LSILKPAEREYVQGVFKFVESEVKISLFTQEPESHASRETRELLEELSSISANISLRVLSFDSHKDEATMYGVSKLPGTVIEGSKDFGIRYFGAPSGYLVSSVIENVVQLSKKVSELKEETINKLSGIDSTVNLQVFVSSTSPYCPALVNLSHRLAIEKENITAHMIDIKEFPHLAMRYHITDVPATVVNKSVTIAGALDEKDFVNKILESLKEK
jgi:glutaredoxin-like protein